MADHSSPPPGDPRLGHGLIGLLVGRPVTVVMGALAALVFGLVSYANLPVELMPDLSYPTLTVRTDFPGAAPEEVETQLARPLEEGLSTIPGLARLESRSRAGQCDVVLELEWGTDMGDAGQAVRERIGLVPLPDGVTRPLVLRYDPNLDPIVRIALTAEDEGEAALARLRRIADEEVKPVLETLSGVAAVKVRGGLEREVRVELDEGLLHARGLSTAAVVQRLQDENVNLSGGSLLEGQTEYLIRTIAELDRAEDLALLPIRTPSGAVVTLSEVGTVRVVAKDRDVVGRIDGHEAVEIAIYREADANVVAVSQKVRDAVFGSEMQQQWIAARDKTKAEAERAGADRAETKAEEKAKAKGKGGPRGKGKKGGPGGGGRGGGGLVDGEERLMTAFLTHKLPAGHRFVVISDQARWIEDAIASVRDDALQGAFLSVIVLLLFLRHIWSTVVISTAIPLSIAATFAPLYLDGRSLNLMSLGGLALASGMLVDAAIVVLESIARCRDEGDGPVAASIRGTSEVFAAVVSATLTTVAVFLPIAFVEGVAGQLFSDLSMTVVYGLLASMIAAFVLVPVLIALPGRMSASDDGPGISLSPLSPRTHGRDFVEQLRAARTWARGGRMLLLPLLALVTLVRLLLVVLLATPIWIGLWTLKGLIAVLRPLGRGIGRVVGGGAGPIGDLFDRLYAAFEGAYLALLRGSLARPTLVLAAASFLSLLVFAFVPRLGAELLPEVHQGLFTAEVRLPVGTPLDRTLEVLRDLETRVGRVEGVAQVHASAGASRDDASTSDQGENSATLTVRVGPKDGEPAVEDAEGLEDRVRDAVRAQLDAVPDLDVELVTPALFSFAAPMEVEVRGHDLQALRAAADAAEAALKQVPALRDVQSHLRAGHPEVRVRYDRERLAAYGLDLKTVAESVRDKIAGRIATDLPGTAQRTDVRVLLREEDRASLADLARIDVAMPGQPPIPLQAVAALEHGEGPSEIRRRDQQRVALVTASVQGFDLAGAGKVAEEVLARLAVDEGIDFVVAGQSDEMRRSIESLLWAIALATFLVYIIMASEFESIVQPLLILFTIPLSAVGIVPALLFSGTPVNVLVLIGIIVLAGVVVDNAIVLVDYANTLRDRGMARVEALLLCGRVRLRPILMTTATTVLGLVPMLLGTGQGAEMRRPLAITLVSGLISSTLLTLVVIPVLLSVFDRSTARREAELP